MQHVWKSFPLEALKVKAASDAQGTFSGYASSWAKDLEGDRIQPGAFAQSIVDKKGKIPIFFNHDSDNWIGFSTSLAEDDRGLLLNGTLVLNSAQGEDVYQLLSTAQQIDFRVGMSIGFIPEEVEYDDNGNRTIKKIDLWETSITPFPANPKAYVDDVKTIRSFEKRLRDVGGFSSGDAKRILALLCPVSSGDPDGGKHDLARDARETGDEVLKARRELLARRLQGAKDQWQHQHSQ